MGKTCRAIHDVRKYVFLLFTLRYNLVVTEADFLQWLILVPTGNIKSKNFSAANLSRIKKGVQTGPRVFTRCFAFLPVFCYFVHYFRFLRNFAFFLELVKPFDKLRKLKNFCSQPSKSRFELFKVIILPFFIFLKNF